MKVPKARKLKTGIWFIQLRLGGESIPVHGKTEKECIRAAQRIKADYLDGKREKAREEPPAEKLPTLFEAEEKYISSRIGVRSPSTIRGYKTIQRCHFQSLAGVSLSDITDAEWIDSFYEEARACSPKTLKNLWRFIGSVVKETCKIELPSVEIPQTESNEREFLEPEQVTEFIKAAHGDKYEIPALLALSSLRRSEICGLRWENVDLKNRSILVKGSVVQGADNKFVWKKTNKTKASVRTVPILMNELYDALKASEQKEGPVVTCNPNTVWSAINRICKRGGLPRVGTHGLRHSFASLCYHLGVPELVTMELGGWDDLTTMRKIYTHISKQDRAKHQSALVNFFSQNANKNANEK